MSMFTRKLSRIPLYNNNPLTLTGDALQHWVGYQPVIATIRQLVSAEDYYFNLLYRSALLNLMAFCQIQPKAQEGRYAVEGGLFYYIIERIITGLKIRQGDILPKGSDAETAAKHEPIWTYMVFITHLLIHSATNILAGDRTIQLFKKSGGKLSRWHPLSGSLFEPETCYQMYFEPRKVTFSREQVVSALIGRWIPGQALRWLQKEGYEQRWWKVLLQHAHPNDELLANLQLTEQQLANQTEKVDRKVVLSKVNDSLETIYAKFTSLIKAKLSDKSLVVNDEQQLIYRVSEGLLIVLDNVLELFLQQYPQYRKQLNLPHPVTNTTMRQFVKQLQGVSQWIAINKALLHEYAIPFSGNTRYLQGVLLPLGVFYDNADQYPRIYKGAILEHSGASV